MRGTAHALIGGAVAAVLATWTHTPVAPLALAGAFGGLLPDIDHPHSTLGRYVPWPAAAVENHRTGFVAHGRRWFRARIVWHRGETHSVGGAVIAGAGTAAGTVLLLRWARGSTAIVRALARAGIHPRPWLAGGLMAAAVVAGYLSHLAADTANVSPQMAWWPFSRRMVHPPWHGIRESTPMGHALEWVVATAAALAAVAIVQ